MTRKWQDGAVKAQQEAAGIEISVAKWELLWWDSAQLLACFNMPVKNMAVIGNYILFNIQLLIPGMWNKHGNSVMKNHTISFPTVDL